MGAHLAQTNEVLCNTTITRMDPSPPTGRDGIAIFNNGPYPLGIYVTTSLSPSFTFNTATRLDPQDTWGPYPLGAEVHVFGITTVLQITGAASIVDEFGG